MNKNFEVIKIELTENFEKYYEDTVKAIIAIEKNLIDNDMIEYVYNDYMKGSYMLMNDCIDDAINEYERRYSISQRKTLGDVKNEIEIYKNVNPIQNEKSENAFHKNIER